MTEESEPTLDAAVDLPPEAAEALFGDMLERFVGPEIAARRAAGRWVDDEPLFRFQVLFRQGLEPEVRLNDEIGGVIAARSTRAIGGDEEVRIEDISGITKYEPRREDEGVPHVTALQHRDGWSLAFQFGRGGHSNRFEVFHLAEEFLQTATSALEDGRYGPFVDNAYSAAELFAKAELLSVRPTVELVLDGRTHRRVKKLFNAWAKLENTEMRFARLLNRLENLRSAARYQERPLSLNAEEAEGLQVELRAMHQHVASLLEDDEDRVDVFHAYATRDLRAGELVLQSDLTIFPPAR